MLLLVVVKGWVGSLLMVVVGILPGYRFFGGAGGESMKKGEECMCVLVNK